MVGANIELEAYIADIHKWQQTMETTLRSETGWLTLAGLFWLDEGTNTVGADLASDVVLPASEGVPAHLGTIEFTDGQATFHTSNEAVTVDGQHENTARLRDDADKDGESLVQIGTVTFFVIQRGAEFGVRVRDSNNPVRLEFAGRNWFPVDAQYRVKGTFIPHTTPRIMPIMNAAGIIEDMNNPGKVTFILDGQQLTLEAFLSSKQQLWFVFRDATSGDSTYGAGRFLYATSEADGSLIVDFNKAYHPPCAFTAYATCARPPKDNMLPIAIPVGERL